MTDIFRHTSITYQIERDEDLAAVALRNGTSVSMIELHYRDVLERPEDCEVFWALYPDQVKDVSLPKTLKEHVKIPWPADKDLKKLVWEKPLSHLSKDLGVSDNAIRKRCKKNGIDLPKNGHWQRQKALGRGPE